MARQRTWWLALAGAVALLAAGACSSFGSSEDPSEVVPDAADGASDVVPADGTDVFVPDVADATTDAGVDPVLFADDFELAAACSRLSALDGMLTSVTPGAAGSGGSCRFCLAIGPAYGSVTFRVPTRGPGTYTLDLHIARDSSTATKPGVQPWIYITGPDASIVSVKDTTNGAYYVVGDNFALNTRHFETTEDGTEIDLHLYAYPADPPVNGSMDCFLFDNLKLSHAP